MKRWPILVVAGLLFPSSAVHAQELRGLAVVRGNFGTAANHTTTVGEALAKTWSTDVLYGAELQRRVAATWVLKADNAALDKVLADVERGQRLFYDGDVSEAVVLLDATLENIEDVLPYAGDRPDAAQRLLEGHLVLWWGLSQLGRQDRLEPFMQRTIARFPGATVSTKTTPPAVAEAFASARARTQKNAVALTVNLVAADGSSTCQLLVNGIVQGEGAEVVVSVPPGRAYVVSTTCGETSSPPRRVAIAGATRVTIDAALGSSLEMSGPAAEIRPKGGADRAAQISRFASAFGAALGVELVVVVGESSNDELGSFVQADLVDVSTRKRICSVRLPTDGVDQEQAMAIAHALAEQAPTTSNMLFAAGDAVHRRSTTNKIVAPDQAEDGSLLWTWIVAGLGVSALTAAVSFDLIAAGRQDDLDDCIASIGCRGTPTAATRRDDLQSAIDWRNGLFVAAGVFSTSSLLIWFLESAGETDTPTALSPWLSREHIGVATSVAW